MDCFNALEITIKTIKDKYSTEIKKLDKKIKKAAMKGKTFIPFIDKNKFSPEAYEDITIYYRYQGFDVGKKQYFDEKGILTSEKRVTISWSKNKNNLV